MTNEQLINIGVVVLLAAGLWFWLSTSEGDVFVDPLNMKRDRVSLSVTEQINQGRTLAPQFEAELGGPLRGVPKDRVSQIGRLLLERLQNLEQQIQAQTGQDPKWTVHPFRFNVLSSEEINAFALPDGSIYITAGLLNQMESDDQVAGILGHELGHVVLRHTARAFESAAKGDILLWALGNLVSSELTNDIASGLNILFQLSFSRDQESKADAFGYVLTCASNFDPTGLKEVFELFQQLDPGTTPEFLRTHPIAGRRIDQLGNLTCEFPISSALRLAAN